MKILIVDDEEDVRVILRVNLESAGHVVLVGAVVGALALRCLLESVGGPHAALGGIFRDLVLRRVTEHTNLLMVRPAKKYPPEPAALLGERISRRALKKQDRDMEAGKDVGSFEPWILRVLNKLS